MGYEFDRFPNSVIEEELVCSICKCVLEDPLQAPKCEHAFCRACIEQWLASNSICPQDRHHLTKDMLTSVPRIMKNLLARLEITCDYESNGCKSIIRLEHLKSHLCDCEYNPTRLVKCEQGCGFSMPKNESDSHSCVKQLRLYIDDCFMRWEKERAALLALVSSSRSDPQRSDLANLASQSLWYLKFPPAKVTRWGALISTPDLELQQMIRQKLFQAKCPIEILNELMYNSHERQWPSGLNSLEVRQRSHASYGNYLLRKIGKQNAVLCLAQENSHMNSDQILEPGFIMIFAHGIEEYSDDSSSIFRPQQIISSSTPNNSYYGQQLRNSILDEFMNENEPIIDD